jgi:putative membrane protein
MIEFAVETVGTALALWVTSLVKPVLKILSFPLSMMTLGLSGLLVNGVVLLGVAYVAEKLKIAFVIGHFPPSIDPTTIAAAVIGAVVLSVVSLAIGLLPFMKTSR